MYARFSYLCDIQNFGQTFITVRGLICACSAQFHLLERTQSIIIWRVICPPWRTNHRGDCAAAFPAAAVRDITRQPHEWSS